MSGATPTRFAGSPRPAVTQVFDLCCALLFLVSVPAVHACRYNVRDLGFMDLETEAYTLYVCTATNAPADVVADLRPIAEEALRDSNVRVQFRPPHALDGEPGARNLEGLGAGALPAARLLSPEGKALACPLIRPGEPLAFSAGRAFRALVDSPTRQEILRETSRKFGVILLLEGTRTAENATARKAIREAINELRRDLQSLPKAIADPPALVPLGVAALERERVLLWSLGLDTAPAPEPRALVIYGKARWIGPLMKGPEISASNLTCLFGVIGADCECGMDLAWTRGTSLPVSWSASHQQAATRTLGFDPDDPLVRMEASRILGRFSSTARPSPGLGYQEAPVDGPGGAGAALAAMTPPSSAATQATHSAWHTTALAGAGLVAAVAAGCLWLGWRVRKS